MTRVMCIKTGGYKELEKCGIYYFNDFIACNPYTGNTFGCLYKWDGANAAVYIGIFPHKLFVQSNH